MTAILRSNNGNCDLTIDLAEPASYAHDPGFESSVSIRSEHWDGDHTHPVVTTVAGLWLRANDLLELHDHVAAWTNQPLEQLDAERLNGAFELARLPRQGLSITFGSRSDTIAHFHPVVTVLIAAGTFRCEFHFVTDQSCLAIFARELSTKLLELQPNAA